jgi:diguanylate cyclase (GGDEF)-like protein
MLSSWRWRNGPLDERLFHCWDEKDRAGAGAARGRAATRLLATDTTRRKSRLWILMVGALLALAALVAASTGNALEAASRRREAERWHLHTLDVLLLTGQLSSSVSKAILGTRGYLMTHDPRFLSAYPASHADARRLMGRLRAQTADNPRQQVNLARAAARLATYFTMLQVNIDLERNGGHEAAMAIVRAGTGRRQVEQVRAEIGTVEAEELRLLAARSAANGLADDHDDRAALALAALTASFLLLAAGLAVVAMRAHQAALQAKAELRRLATTDELTGLPNRRFFMGALQAEIARATRNGSALTLAIVDADHFKRINDTYGHPAGDEVLRIIAELLGGATRISDVLGRLGGEEFGMLMPDTDADQAQLVCERLRKRVEGRDLASQTGATGFITLSTGVAQLSAGESGDALVARADAALYEAKHGGRNQVRMAA